MTEENNSSQEKQREVLQRLRARYGEARRINAQEGLPKDEFAIMLTERLEQTLEQSMIEQDEKLLEVKERQEHLKQVDPILRALPKNRKLREKAGKLLTPEFLRNVNHWLSSTEQFESNLSSTSVEELEQLKKEVQFRYDLLQALLDQTRGELNRLQLYIRAKGDASRQD